MQPKMGRLSNITDRLGGHRQSVRDKKAKQRRAGQPRSIRIPGRSRYKTKK